MDILTDAKLLAEVEGFIAAHRMAPSRFGLEAMGDGALVSQLREGRSLTLRKAEKVLRFIGEYRAPPLAEINEAEAA